jgi:DnaJ-domain-containing protein 1
MIIIWGKLLGLALGVFGGLVGAAFGLLVGHLLDVIAGEFLLRRAVTRFVTGSPGGNPPGLPPGTPPPAPRPRIPRQIDRSVLMAALAVAAVIDTGWSPSDDDTEAFRIGVRKWGRTPDTPPFQRVFARRLLQQAVHSVVTLRGRLVGRQAGRYLDAALRLRSEIDLEFLALQVNAEIAADDRAKMIEICRATLDTSSRGPVRERLRRLAEMIGLSDEWIRVALPLDAGGAGGAVGDRIDLQACKILEVSPDANLEEVKRAYRRLATHFHPDTAEGLSPEQRDASSVAFVRIREAYDRVVSQLTQDQMRS